MTGKSSFVKWMCFSRQSEVAKLTFGSSLQLRSAVVNIGPKKIYLVGIPKTKGRDDNLADLLNILEDISSGFVVSVTYVRYKNLYMNCPHVIILSNSQCP